MAVFSVYNARLSMSVNSSAPGFLIELAIAVALSVWFIAQVPTLSSGHAIVYLLDWFPRPDVELAFRIDGLSVLFYLLISCLGLMVILYTSGYFKIHRDQGRLQWLLLAFMHPLKLEL